MDPTNNDIKKNLWNQIAGFKSIVEIQKYDNNVHFPPSAIL